MNFSLLILGAVALLVAGLFAVQFFTLKWVKRQSLAAIRERYRPQDIVLQSLAANFFGQTSKGNSQVRGNGALVLTEGDLWFRMALPTRELRILIPSITAVDIKDSHLKKTKMRPLLYVEFTSSAGRDSAAWLVEDPQEWCDEIERLKDSTRSERLQPRHQGP